MSWMSAQHWTSARVSGQDHPPVAQIATLLDHVQDVGLSAGASQTREKEDSGPGVRIGMREAVVVVKPIHRYLSSICSFNKLTTETSGTRNSAMWVFLKMIFRLYLCVSISLSHLHKKHWWDTERDFLNFFCMCNFYRLFKYSDSVVL